MFVSVYVLLSRCLSSLYQAPGFAYEKFGVGVLPRDVLLDAARSHFSGVKSSVGVRDKAMYAPHAALAVAKRAPGIEVMSVFVIRIQLV
jgi:hypothetical protein